MVRGALFILASFILSACEQAPPTTNAANEPDSVLRSSKVSAQFGKWGIETEHISANIHPGDDFYRFVNQGWLESQQMPENRSSLSALNIVAQNTRGQAASIITEVITSENLDDMRKQRAAHLYRSYSDAKNIDELGLTPLKPDLDQILEIETHEDAARWMANPRSHSIVGISVWLDAKNPSKNLLNIDQLDIDQGIIGLLSREAYLSDEERFLEQRAAYVRYIADTFSRAGVNDAQTRATDILELEKKLAAAMWTPAQERDRAANYNPMTIDELKAFAPGFAWDAFLEERGVSNETDVILGTDTAVQKSSEIFALTPPSVWASYLAFHWIDNHYFLLPSAFDEAGFDFKGRVLRGLTARSDRDDRAVRFVSRHLGHDIGQLYVEQHFQTDSKETIEELVRYLRRAFDDRLNDATWMDDQTREEARNKLNKMNLAVGYPSKWKNYDGITIQPDDPIGNLREILENNWREERKRLGKPYPDGYWWMNPQTVDASFSPQLNRITFPAGILQAPAFDPHADPAVNFGAIGAIIGHEMGHGFDDQGAKFNARGILQNWWSNPARAAFEERAEMVAEHYASYEVWPEVPLNGYQTLGENIADLAGLTVAYRAYQIYSDEVGGIPPELDGYSADQRFFLGWAQLNRTLWNEAGATQHALRSNHAPGHIRVNASVRHLDAWYIAFDVTPDHDLYLPPEDRIRFW